MVGLTWIDTLPWSPWRFAALASVTGVSLWRSQQSDSSFRDSFWMAGILWGLLYVFWKMPVGADARITWDILPTLFHDNWRSALGFTNYLKFQPPLWTWWLLKAPWFAFQQLCSLCIGAGILCGFYRRRGRQAAYFLLACPLFQIMTTQPSNDWWACGCLCGAVYWKHRGMIASGLLCLACSVKYTTYCLLPLLFFVMPGPTVLVGVYVIGYWWYWLQSGEFWPHEQWAYICHSFTFGQISYYVKSSTRQTGTPSPSALTKLIKTVHFRWNTLGIQAVSGLWWYGFPWYVTPRSIFVILGSIGLLFGFGNIKYFSLCFPLLLLST